MAVDSEKMIALTNSVIVLSPLIPRGIKKVTIMGVINAMMALLYILFFTFKIKQRL